MINQNKISILPTIPKKPTYDSLKKQVKRRDKKIIELENAVKTLKQLCNIQGVKIRELTKKTEILDRDNEAITKATIYYSKRKPLKWWQKLI
tara:strand:- start:217 stop:492 length:276 start_codon:yes stop_codon:yes gene_type:complete